MKDIFSHPLFIMTEIGAHRLVNRLPGRLSSSFPSVATPSLIDDDTTEHMTYFAPGWDPPWPWPLILPANNLDQKVHDGREAHEQVVSA